MIKTERVGLAISGPAGTGKTTIAREMGDILGWEVFGAGGKFRANRPESTNIGAGAGTESEHDSIDDDIYETILRGGIGEGRAAGLIVVARRLEKAYSVLLVCDEEKRYQRIWRRDHKLYKSLSEVRTKTKQREDENHGVFFERYQMSYLDPSLYNLTINTGSYNVSDTLEMIVAGMTS